VAGMTARLVSSETRLPRPPGWMDDALCAQSDPDAWFPEPGQSPVPAKRICAACPVRPQCLDYVLARPEQFGVWGGLTERERRDLYRRRTAA
jgi:WhiB family redox-sensing transcriptional regulator